ncbi:MAG: alpha/beta hydrolase [Candidatus Izemoplasmatales bacterium]|nr:alpha/beta hydrolase [Candidatus Izemoplasmatales bacterium]
MIIEKIKLHDDPNVILTAYIQTPSEEMKATMIKPGMLILPGGGYQFCSDREAEVIALCYLKEGYQCFILNYSLNEKSKYPQPLIDSEMALRLIRKNKDKWYLDPGKIAVIGFSAGAHLATMLATSGKERPNALIVGYPAYFPIPEINYDYPLPVVDELTPDTFIFHTYSDSFVPVRNALYLANGLDEHKIPFEIHVFRDGGHGLSLGNNLVLDEFEDPMIRHYARWFVLSVEWLNRVLSPFNQ